MYVNYTTNNYADDGGHHLKTFLTEESESLRGATLQHDSTSLTIINLSCMFASK